MRVENAGDWFAGQATPWEGMSPNSSGSPVSGETPNGGPNSSGSPVSGETPDGGPRGPDKTAQGNALGGRSTHRGSGPEGAGQIAFNDQTGNLPRVCRAPL